MLDRDPTSEINVFGTCFTEILACAVRKHTGIVSICCEQVNKTFFILANFFNTCLFAKLMRVGAKHINNVLRCA